MDYSPPGSAVHEILQARILEWVAFPSPRDLPDPGIKSRSSTLKKDSLLSEPQGNPYVTRGFPNLKFFQELNLKHRQSKVKNKGVPLTTEWLIEQHWGKLGVICLEGFIHKVAFPGKNFQVVSGFLCHFHLSVAHWATKNRVGFHKEVGSPGYGGKRNTQLTGQVNETQNLWKHSASGACVFVSYNVTQYLQMLHACLVAQSCPTLCDPMD